MNYYKQYMDPNNPTVWGSRAWRKFHGKALYYVDMPSAQERYETKTFYEREFYKDIQCETCRTSYNQFIRQHPIRLNSRMELFNWTIDIHNMVNKKLNKKQLTYGEAYAIWLGTSNPLQPAPVTYQTPYAKSNPYQYTQTIPNISSAMPTTVVPPPTNNIYVGTSNGTNYPGVYPVKYIPIQNYPYQQMAIPTVSTVPLDTIRQNIDRTKQMIRHAVPKNR